MSACLFCASPEACFVELLAWNANEERSRSLLLQGLCTAHASEMPDHPDDPTVSVLHPRFRDRVAHLRTLHEQAFEGRVLPLVFGQRYFALDSPQGAMVRAARDKQVDLRAAKVHAPKIQIDRVPDKAALEKVMRDWAKGKS